MAEKLSSITQEDGARLMGAHAQAMNAQRVEAVVWMDSDNPPTKKTIARIAKHIKTTEHAFADLIASMVQPEGE
jgi:hypothetical protein